MTVVAIDNTQTFITQFYILFYISYVHPDNCRLVIYICYGVKENLVQKLGARHQQT